MPLQRMDWEEGKLKRTPPKSLLTGSVKAECGCELSQIEGSRDHKIKIFLKGRINNLVSKWRSMVKNREELQIKIFSLDGDAINSERQGKYKRDINQEK